MNRQQLEHVIRASGSVAASPELVIVGSQAILGAFPNAPPQLLASVEVDLYPLDDPAKADLIDGSIGELSPFHETFGYYAHGVGPETAVLPSDWRARLVKVAGEGTGGITGWCLAPSDIAISKLVAGREKDMAFVRTMLATRMVSRDALLAALDELALEPARLVRERLGRL